MTGANVLPHVLSVSLWGAPDNWPKCGSEVVFLADAVQKVGRAKFPDQWTGAEVLARVLMPHPDEQDRLAAQMRADLQRRPTPSIANPDWGRAARKLLVDPATGRELTDDEIAEVRERGRAARLSQWESDKAVNERLMSVIEWIAGRCRDGDLETRFRWVTGGPAFPVPAHVWNVEPVVKRMFVECQTAFWSDAFRANKPTYIFVTRDSLTRCLTAIGGATVDGQDLAGLSPYLQIAVSLALKYRDDPMSKVALVATIKEEWRKLHGGDITDTAANHIAATIRPPDKSAIEYGKKARSFAAPKKG